MARDFNGTSDYLTLGSAVLADMTPCTLAGWMKPDATTGVHSLVSMANSGDSNPLVRIYTNTNVVEAVARDDAASIIVASGTTAVGTSISHLAMTVNAAGTDVEIFLNGISDGTGTGTLGAHTLNNTNIGAQVSGGSTFHFCDGRISEVGIWNVQLDAAEIASLAKGYSPLLIRPQSLVAYWPLVRGLNNYKGPAMTVGSGTAVIEHPRVFMPKKRQPYSVAAAGAVTHDTSGALSGQSATVAGTAARTRVHATTGALAGQGSTVDGTAARTRVHTTTGDLAGQGSTVEGAAVIQRLHETTGVLAGPGAAVSGTASRVVEHTTTGAIVGPGAVINGTAQGPQQEVAAQPEPAGAPARDTRNARCRRYIMPDGRVFIATTEEVMQLLQLYAVPKESIAQLTEAPKARPVIRAPQITLEKRDVRFIPEPDSAVVTYRAVISEKFVYRAPPESYRQAEITLNRMRDDEEALVALLM